MNNDSSNIKLYRKSTYNSDSNDLFERFKAGAELDDNLRGLSNKDSLKQELESLSQVLKLLKEIKSETQAKKKLMSEVELSYKLINSYIENGAADEKDLLKTLKASTDLRIKAEQKYLGTLDKELVKQSAHLKEVLGLYDKLNKSSFSDKITKGLKSFSDELSNLSRTLNLDKIVNGGVDSLRNIRKDTMTSMGLSSSEFNTFKNQLVSQVKDLNIKAGGALYNLGDVATYISNLNDMGVYATKLAKEQVEAAIQGNKLLGMSVETQSTMIKVIKRSGNNELLQEQNRVVASLLKSSLDVSKEQLALASGNTANLMDQMAYLGLDSDTLSRLGITATAGQAAITSAYGADTNSAVYSLLSDLAINQYKSDNLFDGADKIIKALNSGNYGSAIQGIFSSDYYRHLASLDKDALASGPYSQQDKILGAMVRDRNKMNWEEYNRIAGMSQPDAEKALEEIQTQQQEALSWQEKLVNSVSMLIGPIDWKYYIGLANLAFATYLASKSWEFLSKGFNLLFGSGGLFSVGGAFTNFTTSWSAYSSGMISFKSALLGSLPAIVGIGSVLLSGLMVLRDIKKADETGISKTQAALLGTETGISNVLWQVAKYTLAGLGVVLLTGLTGGAAAIALGIAAALGIGTGILGSELNKNAKSKYSGLGDGPGSALYGIGDGSTGTNYVTTAGVSTKPWRISSRFGPRRPVKTKNGMSSSYHKGIDLGRKSGTPIGANVAGYVLGKGYNNGAGNWVSIKSADGIVHKYMHMNKPTFLKVGDYVNDAQIIGYVGKTGKSTGAHLHYQMEKNGKAFNPEPYVTRNIMDATASGHSVVLTATEASRSSDDTSLLGKFISENTKQQSAIAEQYANYFATETGVGGGETGISGVVNKGFDSLIEKLDSLAAKQSDQERILAALTGNSSTSLYRY